MRKISIVWMSCIFFFSIASMASAHAVGGKPADAPTLVKQAIDFLVGENNVSKAEMKVKDAFYAVGIDGLNKDELNQAVTALNKSDVDQAKSLLVKSLGKDPKNTNLLELKPHYKSTGLNSILLVLALIFILLGFFIVRSVGGRNKARLNHTTDTPMSS